MKDPRIYLSFFERANIILPFSKSSAPEFAEWLIDVRINVFKA